MGFSNTSSNFGNNTPTTATTHTHLQFLQQFKKQQQMPIAPFPDCTHDRTLLPIPVSKVALVTLSESIFFIILFWQLQAQIKQRG